MHYWITEGNMYTKTKERIHNSSPIANCLVFTGSKSALKKNDGLSIDVITVNRKKRKYTKKLVYFILFGKKYLISYSYRKNNICRDTINHMVYYLRVDKENNLCAGNVKNEYRKITVLNKETEEKYVCYENRELNGDKVYEVFQELKHSSVDMVEMKIGKNGVRTITPMMYEGREYDTTYVVPFIEYTKNMEMVASGFYEYAGKNNKKLYNKDGNKALEAKLRLTCDVFYELNINKTVMSLLRSI